MPCCFNIECTSSVLETLDCCFIGLFGRRGPRVVLRYETCGGLFNQHYCQLAGLTMAAAIGAHAVIMPPALARDRSPHDDNALACCPCRRPTLTASLMCDLITGQAAHARLHGLAVSELCPLCSRCRLRSML